jgi:hypothetical protein
MAPVVNDEATAISNLTSSLDQFVIVQVGSLYVDASKLVVTDNGRTTLSNLKSEIVSTTKDFLEAEKVDLKRVLKEDVTIVSAARGARIISTIYDQFSQLVQWPDEFKELKGRFAEAGASMIQKFEKTILPMTGFLRDEFEGQAKIGWEAFKAIRDLPDAQTQRNEMKQLSEFLVENFNLSTDIEAVSGWRLGSQVRNCYRSLARISSRELDYEISFPIVPMDTSPTTPNGNRVPPKWRY